MQNIDISELRKKARSLNEEKERLYREQDELRKRIREEVGKIKSLKSETDEYNVESTALRNKRDKENKKVKNLIEKIKELREKKKLILKKYDIKDPERIHKRVGELERKIETEALSPSQEKKLMKQINDLKKIFGKDSELEKVMKDIKEVSEMLEKSKTTGDEYHKMLQKMRKGGDYKNFKEISKTITILRKSHKEVYDNFLKTKQQYIISNSQLKDNLKKLGDMKKKERVKKEKEKEKIDSLNVIKIHELAKEVEAKLKKKQKLTTEDLSAFQAQK